MLPTTVYEFHLEQDTKVAWMDRESGTNMSRDLAKGRHVLFNQDGKLLLLKGKLTIIQHVLKWQEKYTANAQPIEIDKKEEPDLLLPAGEEDDNVI